VARSALEVEDSGQARVQKILTIIEQSKFGIHDISRAGIDPSTRLARFNMPLELGFFLGYERFRAQLRAQARDIHLDHRELTFGDYTRLVVGWLTMTPW
jgi:hypothetical protein